MTNNTKIAESVDESRPLLFDEQGHGTSDGSDTTTSSQKQINTSSILASTTTTSHNDRVSSLDFERVINEYSIQALKNHCIRDSSYGSGGGGNSTDASSGSLFQVKGNHRGRNETRWILSVMVGLATGLTTIVIVQITQSIIQWRIHVLDRMLFNETYTTLAVFVGFAALNLVLALGACYLCVEIAPDATGSGIPEVKAYLNGVRVKKFSFWSLFSVKIVGTILSVSSSLAVGMEGPLIHIGAIIGASFTKLGSVLLKVLAYLQSCPIPIIPPSLAQSLWAWTTGELSHFSLDSERRDLISIGASVGFAASFGSPIGGLLFLLDDLSSFFTKKMVIRTLVGNAIGTLCLAIHSRNLSNYSIISLGSFTGGSNEVVLARFELIPFFILIAVAGGVLGGIFCASFVHLKVHVGGRLKSKSSKLLQVIRLSILSSVLIFGLPILLPICQQQVDVDVTSVADDGRQFFCPPGQVNELATVVFGSRNDAIKQILADPSKFHPQTLWTIGILFYVLMTLTCGSVLPSGIFTPTVLVGASLGGAAGLVLEELWGASVTPSTFALLGVAAMLAGIQRSTVSICVILVEGTGEIKVMLPVIIVVLVARYVAERIHTKGLYDVGMALKQYSYLDHEEKIPYDIFQVRQIMSQHIDVVPPMAEASFLLHLLRTTAHNGYPVVDPTTKRFLGLVRRDQIVALMECGVFQHFEYESNHNSESPWSDIPSTSPHQRISKNPLMHLAYHIKDDRYDYLKNTRPVGNDDFDRHELLENIRQTIRTAPQENGHNATPLSRISIAGNDSMPLLENVLRSVVGDDEDNEDISWVAKVDHEACHSSTTIAMPKDFAKVGVDVSGNLVVTWLNPEYCNRYIDLSAVMNRGAYSVPDHLPVSKARYLFTQLGLRHVTVLGGESGGEVVGMLTRSNLDHDHIQRQTGVVVLDNY